MKKQLEKMVRWGVCAVCGVLILQGGAQGAEASSKGVLPTGITRESREFVQRDSESLKMDIYRSDTASGRQPVMLFVFGGGFMEGTRDDESYIPYLCDLAREGITAVAIDYRLGLKNYDLWVMRSVPRSDPTKPQAGKVTPFHTAPMDTAVGVAVEDLFSATAYLIAHAEELRIDTSCVMMSGSSAGAITVLQADYVLCNGFASSELLPAGFRYKGVISFAGAIFSHEGKPDYRLHRPAPTLFFHGNKDRVVTYNKMQLFRKGFFGSKSLARRFRKQGDPYAFFTMEGKKHSVAVSAMNLHDEIFWFIHRYVYQQKPWQVDASLNQLSEEHPMSW